MTSLIIQTVTWLKSGIIQYLNKRSILKNRVEFKSFPVINGMMIVQNSGRMILGDGNFFNNETSFNMAGLYKPTSIKVLSSAELIIGDYSGFSGVSIYCAQKILIGKYVNCGANVCIYDTDFHPLEFMARRNHDEAKIKTLPVTIEDDVFIGANSIILKGAHIGARSVIAAGSIVTGDIPPDQVWGGNPARLIRTQI